MRVFLSLAGYVVAALLSTFALVYAGMDEGPVIVANIALCFLVGCVLGSWGAS